MAVGTVSGSGIDDVWQLISSQTASTSSTITFSSLSGYKKYMVVWKNVATSGATYLQLKINNDTTAGNYASFTMYVGDGNGDNSISSLILDGLNTSANKSGLIVIEDADKSYPHKIPVFDSYTATAASQAILNAVPITQIDLYPRTGTISSGTIQLWGVAA